MQSFYFPASGIVPQFEERSIEAGEFGLHRRLWKTTTFDFATLGARHRIHFSWQLMDAFLGSANCELVIKSSDVEEGREKARLFQAMLYLEGASPFIMPFVTNYSVNQYTGINSRDSPTSFDKDMPQELRTGLTSSTGTVEAWLHDPSFQSFSVPDRITVSASVIERAAENATRWVALESAHSELKAARLAFVLAPSIPHIGASVIHLWHGIEALFPGVSSEVSFRLSLLVAQLCRDLESPKATYKRARVNYSHRSAVAHGRLKSVGQPEWTETWELMRMCLRSVLNRGTLPTDEELLESALKN